MKVALADGTIQLHGTGSNAQFSNPHNIAIDIWGNLYVTDYDSHRIRKVTPSGVVTTLAGGAPGDADGVGNNARFNSPTGIAVDAAGNLYVADSGNHLIRRVTPWGAVSTLAGIGISGFEDGFGNIAQFASPHGIALSAPGNLYVADYQNNRIRLINLR
jgi:DNA-binding beta-propeller fold protein YncE